MLVKFSVLVYLITCTLGARQIPSNLLFGAASASFQIEGAWNEDGKGEGMWDRFLHNRGDRNGDTACDSYHKWQEDIANVKELGLDSYRFSIAWTRILPNGTLNNINQKGIDYYLNLIKGLKAAGIEPLVTLFHYDMPQHLTDLGGLLNPQFVDYFEDFVRLVYQLYGPYVKYWFTINEPYSMCRGGYGSVGFAPGLNVVGDGIYQCSYVLLKAHAKAYRIYDEEFRSKYNGLVGNIFSSSWYEPYANNSMDIEAQERALQFILGWFANPIFLGNWPQLMIDRIANRSTLEGFARSRLPVLTQEEIAYVNGTHDFFAINTYKVYEVHNVEQPIGNPSYAYDMGMKRGNESFFPEGFRRLLNFINDRYKPKSIFITENGYRSGDKLEDQDRITYISGYLNSLLDVIEQDHINIIGYTVWSLMDSFEWGSYEKRYGLIRVDFTSPNRTRTWKESAKWYQNLIATRLLET